VTERGKAIQSTETKGTRLVENASSMYPPFRAMTLLNYHRTRIIALRNCDTLIQHNNGIRRNTRDRRKQALLM